MIRSTHGIKPLKRTSSRRIIGRREFIADKTTHNACFVARCRRASAGIEERYRFPRRRSPQVGGKIETRGLAHYRIFRLEYFARFDQSMGNSYNSWNKYNSPTPRRECDHSDRRNGSGHVTHDDILLLYELPDCEEAWDRAPTMASKDTARIKGLELIGNVQSVQNVRRPAICFSIAQRARHCDRRRQLRFAHSIFP